MNWKVDKLVYGIMMNGNLDIQVNAYKEDASFAGGHHLRVSGSKGAWTESG